MPAPLHQMLMCRASGIFRLALIAVHGVSVLRSAG